MTSEAEPVVCVRHPDADTRLTCGKCGDPICTRCMIQAPVGIRCPNCVTYEFNPAAQVKSTTMFKASAVGIGTGFGIGLLWGIIGPLVPFIGYAIFLISAGAGYLVGLAVSTAANHSRARDLQWPAAGGAVVAFGVASLFMPVLVGNVFGLLSGAIGVAIAISRVRGP